MKKIIILLAVLLLMQFALADAANNTTANNTTGGFLSNVDFPPINTSNLGNATHTGVGPVDDTVNFLISISPFLLLIIGVVILLLSGFAKIIGIILIALAAIRILWMLFLGG